MTNSKFVDRKTFESLNSANKKNIDTGAQNFNQPIQNSRKKNLLLILRIFLPSKISIFILKSIGFNIGKNVVISPLSIILANHIVIGNDSKIKAFTYINVDKFTIGSNTIISFNAQIIGAKGFTTKDNCFVGPQTIIHCDEDVEMGFYSGFGPRNLVYTHGSFLPVTMGYPANFAKVVLEDFVWLGMAVTCMAGTHVESNCIVAPGVVLNSRIKSNTMVRVKPTTFEQIPMESLTRFLKKEPGKLMEEMIEKFLSHKGALFQSDKDSIVFNWKNKTYRFYINAKTMKITLSGNPITLQYDLEEFYTDSSKLKIHQEFLAFIRRYYGITLRSRT